MGNSESYRCCLIRGGSSKGAFFLESDVPPSREFRDRMLLRAFGSPDPRQIDGVGGGFSLASKAMFVGSSEMPDVDVTSHFAQVSVNTPAVDWGGNCGNMTSGVALFAVHQGLVELREGSTPVRILNVNTGKRITGHVSVENGQIQMTGTYAIPGVKGTGARLDLEFHQPGGTRGRGLLPTGHACEELTLADGRRFTVSVVDAANVVVFAQAEQLGLTGRESVAELEARPEVLGTLEELRGIVAEMLELVPNRRDVTRLSPGLPKVGFVASPAAYTTADGQPVEAREMDFQARVLSMQTPHRSYMVAGAVATAVAARIPGTTVNRVYSPRDAETPDLVRFAHPAGPIDVRLKLHQGPDGLVVDSATVGRTARLLMEGRVYV